MKHLTDEQLRALRKVISYLADDEWRDYAANGEPENHIYLDIQKLVDYSEDTRRSP